MLCGCLKSCAANYCTDSCQLLHKGGMGSGGSRIYKRGGGIKYWICCLYYHTFIKLTKPQDGRWSKGGLVGGGGGDIRKPGPIPGCSYGHHM